MTAFPKVLSTLYEILINKIFQARPALIYKKKLHLVG